MIIYVSARKCMNLFLTMNTDKFIGDEHRKIETATNGQANKATQGDDEPHGQGIGKDVGPRAQCGPQSWGKSRNRSPITRGYLWFTIPKKSPRIFREHNKYHGYTVRGTPNCPLTHTECVTLILFPYI